MSEREKTAFNVLADEINLLSLPEEKKQFLIELADNVYRQGYNDCIVDVNSTKRKK